MKSVFVATSTVNHETSDIIGVYATETSAIDAVTDIMEEITDNSPDIEEYKECLKENSITWVNHNNQDYEFEITEYDIKL